MNQKEENKALEVASSNRAVVGGQELADQQIEKASSFLSLFMRDKAAQKVRDKMEEAAFIELEQRVRAFKLHSEYNIQSLEEQFNNALNEGKEIGRGDSAVRIQRKYNEIMDQLDQIGKDFYEKMVVRLERIKNITIPQIKELENKAFEDDIKKYFETRQILFDRFRNIVHEYIKV